MGSIELGEKKSFERLNQLKSDRDEFKMFYKKNWQNSKIEKKMLTIFTKINSKFLIKFVDQLN